MLDPAGLSASTDMTSNAFTKEDAEFRPAPRRKSSDASVVLFCVRIADTDVFYFD
jgi:hypothetical protein